MLFLVNESAPCAAIAVEVSTLKYFNWSTGTFDSTTFAPASHGQPLKPLITSPAALATVQDADVTTLIGRPGVLLYATTVDSAGNPVKTVDIGTPPGEAQGGGGVFV